MIEMKVGEKVGVVYMSNSLMQCVSQRTRASDDCEGVFMLGATCSWGVCLGTWRAICTFVPSLFFVGNKPYMQYLLVWVHLMQ